jgi:hypothetical protein
MVVNPLEKCAKILDRGQTQLAFHGQSAEPRREVAEVYAPRQRNGRLWPGERRGLYDSIFFWDVAGFASLLLQDIRQVEDSENDKLDCVLRQGSCYTDQLTAVPMRPCHPRLFNPPLRATKRRRAFDVSFENGCWPAKRERDFSSLETSHEELLTHLNDS